MTLLAAVPFVRAAMSGPHGGACCSAASRSATIPHAAHRFTLAVAAASGRRCGPKPTATAPPGRFGVARIAVIAAATALIAGHIGTGRAAAGRGASGRARARRRSVRDDRRRRSRTPGGGDRRAFLAASTPGLLPYRGAKRRGRTMRRTTSTTHSARNKAPATCGSSASRSRLRRSRRSSPACTACAPSTTPRRSRSAGRPVLHVSLEGQVRPLAGMLTNVATAGLDRLAAQRRHIDLTATRLVLLPANMLDRPDVRQLTLEPRLASAAVAAPRPSTVREPDRGARAYVTVPHDDGATGRAAGADQRGGIRPSDGKLRRAHRCRKPAQCLAAGRRRSSATTRRSSRSTQRSTRPAWSCWRTRSIPAGARPSTTCRPRSATNHLFRGVRARRPARIACASSTSRRSCSSAGARRSPG